MHILHRAHNIVVNNSQFIDNSLNHQGSGLDGIKTLLEASVIDALHDSSTSYSLPRCFPGTRQQFIEEITSWATSQLPTSDNNHGILWTKGPAGVGKSALAQTCTEELGSKLAAAFFFRPNRQDDYDRLFTTLAYQLTIYNSEYRHILDEKIQRDQTIVTKTISRQFQELFTLPFQELADKGTEVAGMAIFIDGIDEIRDQDVQCEIIDIIAASVQNRSTPFRWAFFSRTEPHLEATFSKAHITTLCRQLILPITREIDGEIEMYLRDGFQKIVERQNLSRLAPWPSDEVIHTLVDAAAGLFIYAATVLRFVGQTDSLGPEEPLRAVLAVIAAREDTQTADPTPSQPFAELDAFYILIMRRIPPSALQSIQLLLLTTNFTSGGGLGWCAMKLANILGFPEVTFRAACNKLHAVIQFQEREEVFFLDDTVDQTQHWSKTKGFYHENMNALCSGMVGRISFYHKSFVDFLGDPIRSKEFCIQSPVLVNILFERCLEYNNTIVSSHTYEDLKAIFLAPGIPNSGSLLAWPAQTELYNSFNKLRIYQQAIRIMYKLFTKFKIDDHLIEKLVNLDYPKILRLNDAFTAARGKTILYKGFHYIPPETFLCLFERINFTHLSPFLSSFWIPPRYGRNDNRTVNSAREYHSHRPPSRPPIRNRSPCPIRFTQLTQESGRRTSGARQWKDYKRCKFICIPFEEDEKDSKTWFLDHNYIEGMYEMFKKVNARERMIGWYHTGPKLRASDQEINDLFKRFIAKPVMVIVDVRPNTVGIPTDAYFAVEEIKDDGTETRKTFLHVPSTIEAEEAEEIGVEHLLRDIKDSTTTTLATRVSEQLASLRGLQSRLSDIQKYLAEVTAGTMPVNHQIVYHLQDALNLLPNLTDLDLTQSFTTSTNDQIGSGTGDCYRCGKPGHIARACPESTSSGYGAFNNGSQKTCYNCGGVGHMSRDCTQNSNQGSGSRCYNCSQTGHISRECPHPQKKACYTCGSESHLSRNCPQAAA
ncbi:26S proteasome regulatory subunit rpn-8 [Leucoagaricus sp. SymC.cos]|nr:26S proteasome regulatory subunit rpn-8 [Leucoagaricus sp. SymC.cos]